MPEPPGFVVKNGTNERMLRHALTSLSERPPGSNVTCGRPDRFAAGFGRVSGAATPRRAQLDDYAEWHGQNVTDALDEALAAYLEWERADYWEAVEGIQQGYEDVKAGRTNPPARPLKSCA